MQNLDPSWNSTNKNLHFCFNTWSNEIISNATKLAMALGSFISLLNSVSLFACVP